MPAFLYKAVSGDGELVTGVLNGTSRAQVINHIQSLGQTPIRVAESTQTTGSTRRMRRITGQHIAGFTRELGTLLHAGIPLERALAILASLAEGDRMKNLLEGVRQQVKAGATLADAMQAQDGVFSRFYLNLVRAGEAGSALEVVLERLAEYLEQVREMRSSLLSALIYPAILVLVALISIFILLGYVVPRFTELFEGVGQVLPLSTRITIATGEFLQHYGWVVLLLAVAAGWLVRYQLGQPRSRYRWHSRFLQLPLAGPIIIRVEIARFARTLGVLLENGVPLLQALLIAKDTAGNEVIASGLERVAGSLREALPCVCNPYDPSWRGIRATGGCTAAGRTNIRKGNPCEHQAGTGTAGARTHSGARCRYRGGNHFHTGGNTRNQSTGVLTRKEKHMQQREPFRGNRSRGFTLIELLVVLVILGLLAGLVGPQVLRYLGSAKSDTAMLQIEELGAGLDLYHLEVGRYPTTEEGLKALVEQPAGVTAWNGPYLKKKRVPVDPWGNEYQYRSPGEHGMYDLYSLGGDNLEGGESENADVVSW
jgi:general secretion pathway protein F